MIRGVMRWLILSHSEPVDRTTTYLKAKILYLFKKHLYVLLVCWKLAVFIIHSCDGLVYE